MILERVPQSSTKAIIMYLVLFITLSLVRGLGFRQAIYPVEAPECKG